MTELLAAIAAIVLALLRIWVADRKQGTPKPPEKESFDEDMGKFDQALAEGNTDDLSSLFDELRLPKSEGGSDTGRSDDKEAGQRELRGNSGVVAGSVRVRTGNEDEAQGVRKIAEGSAMKKVIFKVNSTPDSPELGYGDYVEVMQGKECLFGSHASTCPNPYKTNRQGKQIPWKILYDWIANGEYQYECIVHYRYGKCLLINGGGEVASRNPVKNPDGSTFTEVFVHVGGFNCKNDRWRGSAGCPTIPRDYWMQFVDCFEVGEQGVLIIKPLIDNIA